jgi:hypothetical protein
MAKLRELVARGWKWVKDHPHLEQGRGKWHIPDLWADI